MDPQVDIDDDEGYGKSPLSTPKIQSGVFHFNSPVVEDAVEDVEWTSLEKEINRTCFQLDRMNIVHYPPPNYQTRPPPSPSKKLSSDTNANRPPTTSNLQCQFCAKNGENRSVVR